MIPITFGFGVGVGVNIEHGERYIELALRNAGTEPDGRGALNVRKARQLAAEITAACDRAEGGRRE